MNQRSLFQLSLSSLMIAHPLLGTTVAQARDFTLASPKTFECIQLKNAQSGARFATIALKANNEPTSALLLWKTQEFSDSGFTPERRCYAVTDRLNRAVVEQGGNLGNLWLTIGMIDDLPVLCYVNNTNSGCNPSNVLFTLNKKNGVDPSKVMASLVNFSLTERNTAIQETYGLPYINVGKLVEAASKSAQSSR